MHVMGHDDRPAAVCLSRSAKGDGWFMVKLTGSNDVMVLAQFLSPAKSRDAGASTGRYLALSVTSELPPSMDDCDSRSR